MVLSFILSKRHGEKEDLLFKNTQLRSLALSHRAGIHAQVVLIPEPSGLNLIVLCLLILNVIFKNK
jgi:hypothetical protein